MKSDVLTVRIQSRNVARSCLYFTLIFATSFMSLNCMVEANHVDLRFLSDPFVLRSFSFSPHFRLNTIMYSSLSSLFFLFCILCKWGSWIQLTGCIQGWVPVSFAKISQMKANVRLPEAVFCCSTRTCM